MSKFNVGDKVKIRDDVDIGISAMDNMRGKIVTIKDINQDKYGNPVSYFIVEDNNHLYWSCNLLEPVTKSTKEDKTMSKFKVGDKVKVREDLERYVNYFDETNKFHDVANEKMAAMAGCVVTITEVKSHYYKIKECGDNWYYDMFDTSTIVNTKENNNMNMRKVCYEIADYKYDSKTGETYIKWDDKSETRVKPEAGTEPDQFVGFVTAYAKKAAGNTGRINSFFTQWAIKKPKLDAKEAAKKKAAKAEAKRIAEKRKAKKEKWLVRKAALRIKREYEAAQLAHEEYGVPIKIEGTKLKKKSK